MESEGGRRVIRREIRTTERVKSEVMVRLGSTQAVRLGAKLMFRGLVAKVRRRPVQLTLRRTATHTTAVRMAKAGGPGEGSPAEPTQEQADVSLE